MRLVLMHLDDWDTPPGTPTEAAFIVPGGERAVIMLPLEAIEQALPMLMDAMDELPEQTCEACGEDLAYPPR